MRIAITTETFLPKIDGIVTTLCHLLDHLQIRGHECIVFAPEGGPNRYAASDVIGLRSYHFPLYPEQKVVSPFTRLGKRLARFRPDIVHLVNPVSLGFAGLRHAEKSGIPVIASYHTDLPGYLERWGYRSLSPFAWSYLRWIHNRVDINLCPSPSTRNTLVTHGFKNVRVWGKGVDTKRFNPCYRSRQTRHLLTAGHPDKPLLLYVGRLALEKQLEFLRPVLDALPNTRLAFVGDGPDRGRLERYFAGTPTVFTGYLKGLQLSRAYASADVFVFPSSSETFGNVIVEAQASGIPVVAARAGGPVDIIREGETGLFFEPGEPEALTGIVRRLIREPDYAGRIAAAGRRHAGRRSWETVMDDLLIRYTEAIRAYGPSPSASPLLSPAR